MEWKVSASTAATAGGRRADGLEHGERQVAGQCRQDGASGFFYA